MKHWVPEDEKYLTSFHCQKKFKVVREYHSNDWNFHPFKC